MKHSNFPHVCSGLALAMAAALGGCTHLGTNIAGQFSCRAPKGDCQPLSVIDARAIHELIKDSGITLDEPKQRSSVAAADNQRTSERTMRVVLPAHVDAAGTLHDEAVAWAVVEAPRWTSELRIKDRPAPRSAIDALRNALKEAARRSAKPAAVDPEPDEAAAKGLAGMNPKRLPPEDSVPVSIPSPFVPAVPPARPSTAATADTGAPAPVAEGSAAPAPPRSWTPRFFREAPFWPSAAAIEAAVRAGRAKAEENQPAATNLDASSEHNVKPNLVAAGSAEGPQQ